jgi:hypothetical protein
VIKRALISILFWVLILLAVWIHWQGLDWLVDTIFPRSEHPRIPTDQIKSILPPGSYDEQSKADAIDNLSNPRVWAQGFAFIGAMLLPIIEATIIFLLFEKKKNAI